MPATRTALETPCVALFDLDGTLTWHDTLLPYLLGFAALRPSRLLRLWSAPLAAAHFASNGDRGLLKSRLIRAVMGGEARSTIEAWSQTYVAGLDQRAYRPAALGVLEAHRAAGDHLVLLSASPDLYVPLIGRRLGFERTLCTEVQWQEAGEPACAHESTSDRLDGRLRTPNRRGEEKCKCLAWLRTQYPNMPVVAYGNSHSDLPHLRQADRALLVNASAAARRRATESGIAVADWD
jgi:phosphatidylglycerophosphatase C